MASVLAVVWEAAGFVEVDVEVGLVSHSGNSGSGEFVYPLNLTDIHTT